MCLCVDMWMRGQVPYRPQALVSLELGLLMAVNYPLSVLGTLVHPPQEQQVSKLLICIFSPRSCSFNWLEVFKTLDM